MKSNPNQFNYPRLMARLAFIACLSMILVPQAIAATASLKFNESYEEKLKCSRTQQECNTLKQDEYTAVFSIPITPDQAAAINKRTVVKIQLGKLRIDQKLGSEFKKSTGKATIVTTAKNSVGKKVGSRTMEIKVSDDRLICKLTSDVSDVAGAKWNPVVPNKATLKKAGKYKGGFKASIHLGDDGYAFKVKGKGTVTKAKKSGNDGQKHLLSKLVYAGIGKLDVYLGPPPVVVELGTNSPAGSSTIGTAGGTITLSTGPLAGVTIVVPPGAMISDTDILIASNNIRVSPNSGTFTGTAINIHTGDHNTFDEPLSITFPYDPAAGKIPVPYYIDADGLLQPCQVKSIDRINGTVTFETFHTSLFAWLWQELSNLGGHTAYRPADGFQIVNHGSVFNPGGECFGIAAFAQWHYSTRGGDLYPKFMEDIPFGGSSVKGQNIIAARAHTSVSRLWNSYLPTLNETYNLTGTEVYSTIRNILDNTASPTILYLNDNNQPTQQHASHAVLAYDHVGTGSLLINDPNYPGKTKLGQLTAGKLTYGNYQRVSVIGNGSFKTESFSNILADARAGFDGSGAAQVDVTSHTEAQHVTERTITLSGKVESGLMLVDKLVIWLNGTTKFEQAITADGYFSIAVSLLAGENKFTFETTGTDTKGNRTALLNDQLAPFTIHLDSALAQILVTLTWNTNDTDLDLYAIDPTGGFSAYYSKLTADGGELDYDDTSGFGPEHWTLAGTDTVRWDEPYDVRIHYYSDHQYTEGVPTIPTRWDINVLLYEGTDRAQSYNFSGVLSHDDSVNRDHTNVGADWADVCTIVPVMPDAAVEASLPTMEFSAEGKPRILVPILSEAEILQLKVNPPPRK